MLIIAQRSPSCCERVIQLRLTMHTRTNGTKDVGSHLRRMVNVDDQSTIPVGSDPFLWILVQICFQINKQNLSLLPLYKCILLLERHFNIDLKKKCETFFVGPSVLTTHRNTDQRWDDYHSSKMIQRSLGQLRITLYNASYVTFYNV